MSFTTAQILAIRVLGQALGSVAALAASLPACEATHMISSSLVTANQAMDVLKEGSPAPVPPMNGTAPGDGRGLNGVALAKALRGAKKVVRSRPAKSRCACGRVVAGKGPMARHKSACPSAVKAAMQKAPKARGAA